MQFNTYLKTSIPKIDKALFEILNRWETEMHKINPILTPLVQEFVKSCKGGKRLRGVLVCLGYGLAGGKPNNEIYKIAAAYELFHTAILVHDDIIDQSNLRRGNPSLYHALGGDRYGVSQAISLGDAGFFLALKTIADSLFPDHKKNKATQIFINSMLDTATGEMLDVGLPKEKEGVKEGDVLAIAKLKTARYSFAGPLMVGAVLANAKKRLISDLEKFGESIGIAFQIQDDLLGIFGNQATIGKSVVSDIEEGKITFLLIHAKQKADKNQRMILDRYYGKKDLGKAEIKKIKDIFIQVGSDEYAQQKVSRYMELAKAALLSSDVDEHFQKMLVGFADFLIDRKK